MQGLKLNFDRLSKEFDPMDNFWDNKWQRYFFYAKSDLSLGEIININFSSVDSRYLMFIGNQDITQLLIQNVLFNLPQIDPNRIVSMIGSSFKYDKKDERYELESIKRIIDNCENEIGTILLLQNFDHIYPSLYDLFNKNFSKLLTGESSFCQISVGSIGLLCRLHKDFKCIIFINDDSLDKYDPPFLNRFEKHFLELDPIISEFLPEINYCQNWLLNIIIGAGIESLNNGKNDLEEDKEFLNRVSKDINLFICSYHELLAQMIIFNYTRKNKKESSEKWKSQLIDEFLNAIIPCATLDFYIIMKRIDFIRHNQITSKAINLYEKIHCLSFIDYAKNEITNVNSVAENYLIYTYDQCSIISIKDIIEQLKVFKVIVISNIKREMDLRDELKQFYSNSEAKTLIIICNIRRDWAHFNLIKFILNEYAFKYKKIE